MDAMTVAKAMGRKFSILYYDILLFAYQRIKTNFGAR